MVTRIRYKLAYHFKNLTIQFLNIMYLPKSEYDRIQLHKARGAMIRSKCKWVEEGERNTRYFLNLEKNFKYKMHQIFFSRR